MSTTYNGLEQNQIIEAEEWLVNLGRKATIADITQASELGIRLDLFGQSFVLNYTGSNNYVNRIKRWAERGMTQGQLKVVLEIYVETSEKFANLDAEVRHQDDPQGVHECPYCDEVFNTYDNLNNHKVIHGAKRVGPERTDSNRPEIEGIPVIADLGARKGLDLSNLPDGCYADYDPSGKQELVFFMVKRVKHTHFRDRRYRYGKIVTGSEVTLAGTIEVREWTSDAKRLLGEQRPGDVYRGEFEEQLEHIMALPDFYAKLFGVKMKRCFVCRKALTDDISKAIGMGKDCEEKYGPSRYFQTPVDNKRVKCPTCGGEDVLLTYIENNGTVRYSHLACSTSFKVDKKGEVSTTNKV